MKKTIIALAAACLTTACTTTSFVSGQKSAQYTSKFGLSKSTAETLGLGINFGTKEDFAKGETVLAKAGIMSEQVQSATIIAMLASSDAACEDYMAGMVTASKTVMSALGVTTLGLTSAAALTSPQRSVNMLSGIASFTGGSERELTDTVLGGNSPQLIYKAVKAVRKRDRARIVSLATSDGGFGLAAVELADYHAQCGPTIGVNALESAVSLADQTAAEDGIAEAAAEKLISEEIQKALAPVLEQVTTVGETP